jgi:uncharacterized protein (DUF427 family)
VSGFPNWNAPPGEEHAMRQAVWNGAVIAASDDTQVVEGFTYFPRDALRWEYFTPSESHTRCAWKGTASYYTITVAGKTNPDAAWYYPEPSPAARHIDGHVGFWRGVLIEDAPTAATDGGEAAGTSGWWSQRRSRHS